MKHTVVFITSIVLILLAILVSKFYLYKENYDMTNKSNLRYEKYLNNEVKGTDIATLVNLAVDDNENNSIKKDEQGKYIQDEDKSIRIEIKITEFTKEELYSMETLYSGGMGKFVQYYGQISFKCIEKMYHKNGKIKYILFEQIKF